MKKLNLFGKKNTCPSGGAKKSKKKLRLFSYEQKLKAVKLVLEEKLPRQLVIQEISCGKSTFESWLRLYRQQGSEGLKRKRYKTKSKNDVTTYIKKSAVTIKKENPEHGIKRITNYLRRMLFLPASTETVRKALKESDLIKPPKKKRLKNIHTPRFFERSNPNQLWQSDITMFRIKGKQIYLIGYIDDYSRFIVGLGLYTAQTAVNVIELYRKAALTYKPPKEMLTDNGRQYVSWRGKTRFQAEMKKDSIHHIRSQPHHPMTLGKIERFWKSIKSEFISRALFEDFDSARERIELWRQYYNHRRPHQGIGGVCPADRYYEIQTEVKKAMEQGIEDNILEIALRGTPKAPFYMIGRMGEQTVLIQTKKGKVHMNVDGESEKKEFIYDLEKDKYNGKTRDNGEQTNTYSDGSCESGIISMDGTEKTGTDLQGVINQLATVKQLGRPGDGCNDSGVGTAENATGKLNVQSQDTEVISKKGNEQCIEKPETSKQSLIKCTKEKSRDGYIKRERTLIQEEDKNDNKSESGNSVCSTSSIRNDIESTEWSDDSNSCGEGIRSESKNLLRVGGERITGNDGSIIESSGRSTEKENRQRKRESEESSKEPGKRITHNIRYAPYQGAYAERKNS